jgi:hypothetical protein
MGVDPLKRCNVFFFQVIQLIILGQDSEQSLAQKDQAAE